MSTSDLHVRERATRELDQSMALEAGAGSGKTSVLVARIVGLLASGRVPPKKLAAITFTEKAAGELAERVRDALELELVRASNEATRATVGRVLDDFSELTLSTIHGFCRDLLLRETLEAGFAPDTEIGEVPEIREHLRLAIAEWRRALRKTKPHLAELARQLVERRTLEEGTARLYLYRAYGDYASPHELSLAAMYDELAELAGEITRTERACRRPDECKLIESARALVEAVRATVASRGWQRSMRLVELLASDHGFTKNRGQKAHWDDADKEEYIRALDRALAWRKAWRIRAHGELVRSLRALVLPELERRRRDASLAGFDDLLADAARLLRDDHAARRRLSASFDVILIDEVQDTDPVQAEIAALLSDPACTNVWHEATPERGRLFAVGDPKQSIYRFRGADVGTFQRIQAAIARNGHAASLVANFRSVPGIVAWVNHVFAELPGYAPQQAHRAPAALDPVVLLEPRPEGDEIDAVIRHLADLLERKVEVVDRETNVLRPLRPRDVMILLPSWTHADETADRLRAVGLECVVEGGNTFFARDEVRLGLGLARAIVEPRDTEAVALVLRGVFGLSHVELAHHAARGGRLFYTAPEPPPGPVAEALAILLDAHRRRASRPLATLLADVFAATRVRSVWKLLPDGLSRLANLDKLFAMLREEEAAATSPLAAVDALVARARRIFAQEKDIDRLDRDGEAIRITSLFKAKGLEAPVVVLVHAARKAGNVTHVVDHSKRTLALKLGPLEPPDWEKSKEREGEEVAEERRRWMYVAATRARDQLVLVRTGARDSLFAPDLAPRGLPPEPLAHEEAFEPVPSAAVRVRLAAALSARDRIDEAFPGLDAEIATRLHAPPASGDPEGDARAREVDAKIREATRACVRWRAASDGEGVLRWGAGMPSDADHLAGGGARAGRVVHAVMERLDLSRPHDELEPEADRLAEVLARDAGLGEAVATAVKQVLHRILANPLIEEARRAPERWHEVPFTYGAGRGTIVAGTIDLCFPLDVTRTRWVIIDWKADLPKPGSPLHERYRAQLAHYARALLANLGDVEIVKTELVGPHPELGPFDDRDDDELVEEVEAEVDGTE